MNTRVSVYQAACLGTLQFLFLLTWVVYATYLGDLLNHVGLPRQLATPFLLFDQLIIAVADVMLGFYADRFFSKGGRLVRPVLILNLLSCAAFITLPLLTNTLPVVFIGLTAIWLASSSVLRAPLYASIARSAGASGNAVLLLGLGLAAAVSPYLGLALKTLSPLIPFLLSGGALAIATLAFGRFESGLPAPQPTQKSRPSLASLSFLLPIILLLGAGYQIHFFVNSVPLFKAINEADNLPYFMPVFWIGFSLAVYPGAKLATSIWGYEKTLTAAATLGAICSSALMVMPDMLQLVLMQLLLGAAWGVALLSALGLAAEAGHAGRESTYIGLLFSCLAVATVARIAIGWDPARVNLDSNLHLTTILWSVAAIWAFYLMKRTRPATA